MSHIKIVACYLGNQKEFSSEKASIENEKTIFCSKFFYNIEQERNKNIFNFNCNMPQF
jgi:hypothetical protein